MAPARIRLHPLVAGASAAIIIASVTAAAVMTGILPSSAGLFARRGASGSEQPTVAAALVNPSSEIQSSGNSANGTTSSGGSTETMDRGAAAGGTISSDMPKLSVAEPQTPPARMRPSPPILAEPDQTSYGAAQPLPAVFIHVYSESGRQQMLQLEPRLRQYGMRLAGVKIVDRGPAQSDLRYFHASEKTEALQVQAALLATGLPVHKLKSIGGYESRALTRQYEVWLSHDFQAQQ